MTCKDCIHYEVCKNTAYEYAGEDAASAYNEGSCCRVFAEACEHFSDKSEWLCLLGKNYETAYYVVGYGDKAEIIAEPICGWGVKDGRPSVIDACGALYEIDTEVYLTKEDAEKDVERKRRNVNKSS